MAREHLLGPEVRTSPRARTFEELARSSSRRRVRAALDKGEVVRLLPDCYVAVEHAQSFAARASAAARFTGGVVTAEGALFAAGALDRAPREVTMHVAHGTKRVCPDWLVLTRANPAPTRELRGGLRVASPRDAILHLWAVAGADGARGPTLAALQRRTVTLPDLESARAGLGWMRHSADFADTLAAFAQGAHSYLEYEGLRKVFVGKAFDSFIRQHYIVARRRSFFLDMFHPRTRTVIEMDGGKDHAVGERRQYDIRRDADLATLGILTLRLSYDDLMRRPDWCRATARAVVSARSGR